MVAPVARHIRDVYGLPASALIAQAALETKWGTRVVDNAYFGVKGTGTNGSTTFRTHEVVNGELIAITDSFRAYGSLSEAAEDYAREITTDSRWSEAVRYRGDPMRYVSELHKAGYATDPEYTRKVQNIIRFEHLRQYDRR
jgi:flagellar protein FlgJ